MRNAWSTAVAMTALVAILTAPAAYAGPVKQREARQHARIRQGVRSGELTRGEAKVLNREQRTIGQARKGALADGHIGPREARALSRMQNQASRDIFRLKHNGREAGWAQ